MTYRLRPWILLLSLIPAATALALELGSTMDDVIGELGKPLGYVERGGVVTLIYDGGGIELKDGVVVFLPEDFVEVGERREKIRAYEKVEEETVDAFEEEQFSKGLVKHEGQWVTREERSTMIAEKKKQETEAQQNQWRVQRQVEQSSHGREPYRRKSTAIETNESTIARDLDALRRSKTKTKLHSLTGEENRP